MLLRKVQLKELKNSSNYLSLYGTLFVILNVTIIIAYAQGPLEHFHSSWPSEIVWYYNSNTGFTYGDLIYSVDISPDGQFVVGGGIFYKGDPFRINLFKMSDGTLLKELRGHSDIITSLDFSPIGGLIVSGSYDGTVRLWDINGNLIRTFYIGATVYEVCFSPDGQLIAIGEDGGFVAIYRINGELVKKFKAHTETTFSVAFSPDGRLLATGSDYPDFSIKIWRTSDWSLVKTLTTETGNHSLSFSPDGRFLASAGYAPYVKLWKIPEWEEIVIQQPYTSEGPFSVAFAPSGNYLAVGSYASYNHRYEGWHDIIYFYDINGRQVLPSLGYRDFPVAYSVAFSPDGTYLVSGMDGGIALWRVITTPVNRPPRLTRIFSPPDKGVATGQPWFCMQAEDPDDDRLTYRIELKKIQTNEVLVFDQMDSNPKGWWMPEDEWRQTPNRRTQVGPYASGAKAQFQPSIALPEGIYEWRVIISDGKGGTYESQWLSFRVIKHNPIVLVHGFDFAEIIRGYPGRNPANWNNTVRVLEQRFGYQPLYIGYDETDKPIGEPQPYADLFVVDTLDTSRSVSENAEFMQNYMRQVVRPRLSDEVVVDLIGHSMGGLIARAYVQQIYSLISKIYPEIQISGGRETAVLVSRSGRVGVHRGNVGVQRVVTIGTPHSGAALAEAWVHNFMVLPAFIIRISAVEDLSFRGAANLNKVYPPYPGVQYILIPVITSYGALPSDFGEFGLGYLSTIIETWLLLLYPDLITQPSDGVVHVWSANWLYNEVNPRMPGLKDVIGPNTSNVIRENPIDMGLDQGAHFNVIHAEDKISEWMKKYLTIIKFSKFRKNEIIIANSRQQSLSEPIQVSSLWQGLIKQAEVQEHVVTIDTPSITAFVVNWWAGDVVFELQTPTGEWITEETANGNDVIFDYLPNLLIGKAKVFLIKNASQGRWVMRVRGESDIPPDGTPALMWAVFYSPLKLNIEIPKAIYSIGEGTVLKAQLTKAGQPVTGATVTAEVIQPDGQLVTVNLLDDGEHQDGRAGDGVYGAVLTNLTEPGTYRFIVTAKGQTRQEGGTNFERSAMGSFEVASPAARLAGGYADEGMDEDNDGLFERLRVDVQVQVQQAGNFTLSGALADGSGRIITQASVSFEAATSGVVTVSLPFDGESIGNWGYSGRFQLRDITLLHQTDRGWIIADIQEHPYDTREYQANQFPSTLSRQSHYLAAGLHFISIPMDLANSTWSFLLGQITLDLKVATWVGDRYAFYPQEPANEAQLVKAYWVKLNTATNVTALGRKIAEDQPYVIALRQGWNAIGIPFISSISWNLQTLKIRRGSEEKTLEQAQQAGWIRGYAWGWKQDENNPNTGKYVLIYDQNIIPGITSQLEPWKGYWVYAHTDCELVLPPPSQGRGRGTRGEGRVAKGNGWSIRLQASVDGSVGEAVIGVAQGGRGLTAELPPDPPTGNNSVQVILLKNNVPLAVDVRNDVSVRQEWDVLVRWDKGHGTRGTGERREVTLTFDGIGYAPKDVSAWLVDTVTGKRLYLRTQASYRFVAQEGEIERKFKLIVEGGNERPLRVVGLRATPMRGQGVVIEFSLTKPARVQAEVMTLTGRKVAVLDTPSSDGLTHRLMWRWTSGDGNKVGVGPYLIRILATDEEGRQVQATTVVKPK